MAREFRLLSVLWLVVACIAVAATTSAEVSFTLSEENSTIITEVTTPQAPTATTTVATTTNKGPTITTAVATTITNGPTITTAVATTITNGPTITTAVATDVTTTTADQTNTTVDANTTTDPVDPSTRPPVPTTTPDPCAVNLCPHWSTCEARVNQTFTCLCLAGEYNSVSGTCGSAKVFPGKLGLPRFIFNGNMTDKTSQQFQESSQIITLELKRVFGKTDGYSGSIVLEIRKLPKGSTVWTLTDGTSADVEIFFTANTNISSAEVEEKIENEAICESCLLKSGTFNNVTVWAAKCRTIYCCDEKTRYVPRCCLAKAALLVARRSPGTAGTSLCDKKPCELKTSTCVLKSGSFGCNCLDGYIKTDFSNRMCIACPSGEMADGSGACIDCSFGKSGFNCNEPWELVLVIVGTVLGGLLLITLILLPVLLHKKSSKKSSKKNNKSDTEKSYNSHLPAKAPLVNNGLANGQAASFNGPANSLSAFANAGVPRIPRATSTNSWNSRTNLEMAPSNGRQNLIPMGKNPRLYDDHEDMNPYAQARPQSSLYAQARPQNNPYAQNRPQTNPYDQSQGHSNPYYVHDNGRRFN